MFFLGTEGRANPYGMAVRVIVLESNSTMVRDVSLAHALALLHDSEDEGDLAHALASPREFFRVDIDRAMCPSERQSLRVDGTVTLLPFSDTENCDPASNESICASVRDAYLRLCEDLKEAPLSRGRVGATIVFRIM